MGSSRKNKGKSSGKNRVWDDWQRYVRKETQRLKQKSSGNVVEVKFPTKKPRPDPPAETSTTDTHVEQPRGEYEARRAPVEGVSREEALQVSDDNIGRTVRPFTVNDYRDIKPMNSLDPVDDESAYISVKPEPGLSVEDDYDPVDDENLDALIPGPPSRVEPVAAKLPPVVEDKPQQKRKGGKKKKKERGSDGELELFGTVTEHQGMARQRLTKKSKLEREELIEKLLDPVISLDEASTLIGVCKTTVRRYTNKGELECLRTPGQQRRFRLSHVLEFVKNREVEQRSKKDRKPRDPD